MRSSDIATHLRPTELTEANLKAAQPGDVLHDAKIGGLHARCKATRTVFFLYYRTKAGVERRQKLGVHGSITLAQARKLAGDLWLEIGAGKDPAARIHEARKEPTVTDLWEEFWERHASSKKSSVEDDRLWRKFLRPALGSMKLSTVRYEDVADLHKSLEKTPIQANRVLALASTMFSFAVRPLRWCEHNPTEGVVRYRENKRKRYMTSEEAARISSELDARQQKCPASVAFIRLLILTGARAGEIAKAKWSQVKDNRIVLTEHKTDKTGHDRIIHLSPMALEVLGTLPRTETGTITGIKSPRAVWEEVREAAGCPDLHLHDLRHSFASVAVSAGYGLDQIGELLGHSSASTTKRYAHLIDEAASKAVQDIGGRIAGRMAG